MESEKITPDRKMKNLLSSYISKTLDEQGRKRKRSLTEIQSENTVQAPSDRERKKNVDSQDEDAFFERVETYDMMSWFAKPMELSPLVCSRFGWKNTESDMLQCVGCKAVLCGQLPKRADSLIYNESCKKLKDNLRMAHMKSCFWPAYPSPEYFSSIPIRDKRKVTSRIIAYIESLQKLEENLPHISFKTFDDKGMSANYLEEIKCTVEKQFEQNHLDNVEVGTFCLAVTGWKGINSKEALLSCHYCRRKVGLWNYKNNHNKDDASEDSSEDSDTDVKYSDSKSAIPVIESQTCTENANNHQETNQKNGSHSSVQSDACVEKCFNFSQPNVIDSKKINETDTSLSVQSNISSGNIYSFSQPNILECSNEIVDGGMTNECNKMSENDKSETTNDTIINEQNKLLSNGKHDLKSLESSSSGNNTNIKEIDSLSEKIELKQDQVKESQASSNSSLEEGNSNDKSVEESHMSSDISVEEGNTNDKSVEESHMSSDISVEEGNTNDKSVEESHMSSDISVEEGNTNDKSVEESHMSSDISVEEGSTNDKSVEENHMSSDISVEEGNTNDKSVEESHMSSDISVEEGSTNDKSVEESHMSSDISVDVSSQKNSTGDLQNNDTNVAEVAEPPKRKKIKVVKKDTFDPLEEHRYWCPWIIELPEGITCSPKKISVMTEGGEKKASYPWEHVLQIICPSFFNVSHEDSVSEHFKQHSPVAGLRQLRNLMREWSN